MESRSAPTSKNVRCPDTSTSATWSRWWIFTTKFTRNNLSRSTKIITRLGRKGRSEIPLFPGNSWRKTTHNDGLDACRLFPYRKFKPGDLLRRQFGYETGVTRNV